MSPACVPFLTVWMGDLAAPFIVDSLSPVLSIVMPMSRFLYMVEEIKAEINWHSLDMVEESIVNSQHRNLVPRGQRAG
jgi:hypothetical protein